LTLKSQINATKTAKVMPIFPILTTAALNTKTINRVGLFSAERRMGIILGWLSTKCSKWWSEEMIAFILFIGFAVWFEVYPYDSPFHSGILLVPNRSKRWLKVEKGVKGGRKTIFLRWWMWPQFKSRLRFVKTKSGARTAKVEGKSLSQFIHTPQRTNPHRHPPHTSLRSLLQT